MKVWISGAGDFINEHGEMTSFIVVTTERGLSEQIDVGQDGCAFIKKLLTEVPSAPAAPQKKQQLQRKKLRAVEEVQPARNRGFAAQEVDEDSEFVDEEDGL